MTCNREPALIVYCCFIFDIALCQYICILIKPICRCALKVVLKSLKLNWLKPAPTLINTLSTSVCSRQCKLGIVKFIEAEQVPEVETVVHLVVASSDTRHSVATAADLELKSKQR